MDMYQTDYIKGFWYFCGNLLQLIVFTSHFIFEPRFHVERCRSKNRPQQRPPVQVTKLPITLFVFLRVPLTHLGRWFAFTIKIPRDYICSLTKCYEFECFEDNFSLTTSTQGCRINSRKFNTRGTQPLQSFKKQHPPTQT